MQLLGHFSLYGLEVVIDFALALLGSHVGRIRSRMGKSLVAKLALKRFVSSMNPYMLLEGVQDFECLESMNHVTKLLF